MIALEDIGWFGTRAFTDSAALNRREIDLAGDVRTMSEAAEILTEALGRPIAFAQTPIEQVWQYSKEMALMLESATRDQMGVETLAVNLRISFSIPPRQVCR